MEWPFNETLSEKRCSIFTHQDNGPSVIISLYLFYLPALGNFMPDYKMKYIYGPFKMSAQRPLSFYPYSDRGDFGPPPPLRKS